MEVVGLTIWLAGLWFQGPLEIGVSNGPHYLRFWWPTDGGRMASHSFQGNKALSPVFSDLEDILVSGYSGLYRLTAGVYS